MLLARSTLPRNLFLPARFRAVGPARLLSSPATHLFSSRVSLAVLRSPAKPHGRSVVSRLLRRRLCTQQQTASSGDGGGGGVLATVKGLAAGFVTMGVVSTTFYVVDPNSGLIPPLVVTAAKWTAGALMYQHVSGGSVLGFVFFASLTPVATALFAMATAAHYIDAKVELEGTHTIS